MSDKVAEHKIPTSDQQIPDFLEYLRIPGLADIHIHFMSEPMLQKVRAYFDRAEHSYGRPGPVTYRLDEDLRIKRLREIGIIAIPA